MAENRAPPEPPGQTIEVTPTAEISNAVSRRRLLAFGKVRYGNAVVLGGAGRMSRLLLPLVAAAVAFAPSAAVVFAPPAAATHDDYTRFLQERYIFLTEHQLIKEGYRVCAAAAGGMPAGNITQMVVNELDVSVSAANEIVSAATLNLC
ncbi:DUF732 domain-containing protein [Mycobacterium deserti]|uniref:DUF732 domain-containing protein n=1 Tax=Mycobacterium deserti TaxID=2978347 RepID=A0ABT2MH65_9MYCO|nr:DUF732 domain-containing protein [Mycobacterium deserti]MCT7661641.1 hypothetical protein [Mycobacterium deserti]